MFATTGYPKCTLSGLDTLVVLLVLGSKFRNFVKLYLGELIVTFKADNVHVRFFVVESSINVLVTINILAESLSLLLHFFKGNS